MKKVLISTLAATAFIASGAAFADDVDGSPFTTFDTVDQTASVSSTFDGFNQSRNTENKLVQNEN